MDFQLHLATESVVQARPEEPLIVAPATRLRDTMELMQSRRRGSVMVCSAEGSLEGILTERDIVKLLAANTDLEIPIEQVMIRSLETVTYTDSVGTAIAKMARGGYRRLPVVDEVGHPTGVLGVSRILEYLVEHFPKVIYTLPPQPHQSAQDREGA